MKWHPVPLDTDFLAWLSGQCPESSDDHDDDETPEDTVTDRGTIIDDSIQTLAELRRMAA